VLEALEETGLVDRTVIVLTSPHGHHLGENGRFGHNTLYEPDLRIPWLWVEPQAPNPGQRVSQVVQLLDLAPSILVRAGATLDETMPGQAVLPLLSLSAGTYEDRDVLSVNNPRNFSLRASPLKMVRVDSKKSARSPQGAKSSYQLFDLESDPLEAHDLMLSTPPAQAEAMRTQLNAFERTLMETEMAKDPEEGPSFSPELRKQLQDEGYWHNVDPKAGGPPPKPTPKGNAEGAGPP
jgi:arylsulfatase A-like enzyme